jgi:uncharacterized protein YndB with AHSA1/START domain
MTSTTEPNAIVRLQRTIPATPDQIYRAWLDPDTLRRWMAPAGFENAGAEVDERVGGRYRIYHAQDGADRGGFESELIELVPNERIVFLWRFVGPERVVDPALDSRLTISLRDVPDGTELTLLHERLDALEAAMPGISGDAAVGWGQALDKLAALCAVRE